MSLFDLSWAVDTFATDDVVIRRNTGTTIVNGRVTARASTTHPARGCVQPISGSDLKRLPEGVSSSNVVSIWLTTNDVKTGDEITLKGERFQVVHRDGWGDAGNYTKAIARKLDGRESAVPP